ncbi:MAG TPA: rhodanese-like domain-containing protein [Acidimicrobiia bacterium]|nr:rhodanese-like domain-containing protein [Acidimicrobiia bacterium]
MPKSIGEKVAEIKTQIENLSVDEVAAERDQGALIIDIRESEELARTGKIPGSLHIPRGMLEFHADPTSRYHNPELSPDKRIILHCAGGIRSALGVAALKELGYDNIAHLEGGFGAWAQEGGPVEAV